jgi:hypothetical protein
VKERKLMVSRLSVKEYREREITEACGLSVKEYHEREKTDGVLVAGQRKKYYERVKTDRV